MTRAAVYVRQSVKNDEGIDRATDRCTKLVGTRGWELAGVYADNDVSASKRRTKTQWAVMLKDIRAGRIDVVVGVDVDRLVRSIQDLGTLIDLGVRVLTVDGEIDLTTADGEFRATMLAGIARFEVRRKAERQTRASEHRTAKTGLPVPGKRRYGFEPGNIIERAEEADNVRWAYEQIAEGNGIYGIAKALGWATRRVRETLTNPSYAGWVVRHGERFEAHESVARVVDRSLWETVQAVLSDPSRKTTPGSQVTYLASGIARCGVCGARMVKQSSNYLCKGNLSHPTISQPMLDKYLAVVGIETLINDASTPRADRDEIKAMVSDRAALVARRQAWQEQATWPDADVALIRTEISNIGRQIAKLDEKIASARVSTASDEATAKIIERMLESLGAREAFVLEDWLDEWNGLALDTRRDVLKRRTITVKNGRGLSRVSVD